ncbi:class I SAM-dependent methyltransferase [Amycolatopsis benzoatilytica]|uniref:class I SAM-dependent methyltransferase n=1 Tax=Amycolatopsis benzoatilytica TaxID=346045 RepID=UPI00037403D5|nr:SAM-dependent methyltransferase [Amycolatopsis benzoatilytica]
MEHGGPSRTALVTAWARAVHQVADQPRILTDPLVARLVGSEAGAPGIDRPRRLFFAARARFAEDRVAHAVADGVRQAVFLGAGLDTFGCRNPYPDLRVFEVDHPATQEWKRERLALAGIDCPATATFVPLDFETGTLAAALAAAGFQRSEPAVFVWLGVVFYLTPAAARATLDYIAGQARPAEVVFDYLQPADNDEERAHLRQRADRLAAEGEPLRSFFAPDEIAAQLRALGFAEIDDYPAADLVAGYLDGQPGFEDEPSRALRASRVLRARR